MTADLGSLLNEHYGLTTTDVQRALSTLPAIHRESAALTDPEAALFDAAQFAEDPEAYARVVVDTVASVAQLISSAYTAKEVAELLGVNESRVRQRRLARTLWAVEDRDGWVFPALQFHDVDGHRRQLRHLDRVLPVLPADVHPLAVAGFLTTPQPDLWLNDRAVSPLEWLASGGNADAVLSAAEVAHWAAR